MKKNIYISAVVATISPFATSYAQCQNFNQWKQAYLQTEFVKKADNPLINNMIKDAKYLTKVIGNDRNQPEFKRSFADYTSRMVSPARTQKAKAYYQKLHEELKTLEQQYGVAGEYLLAFWGLETNFGQIQGDIKTIDALATLSCDPRRSKFFTHELNIFLELVAKNQLPKDAKASWAGAMGHLQFMPNKIQKYQKDGNNNGKIDIFGERKDAFESAAFYLQQEGWKKGIPWGHEVSLPKDFDPKLKGRFNKKPLSFWHELGVISDHPYYNDKSNDNMKAAIVIPRDSGGKAFMTYSNFDVIMIWNKSIYYAISVGMLADLIKDQ